MTFPTKRATAMVLGAAWWAALAGCGQVPEAQAHAAEGAPVAVTPAPQPAPAEVPAPAAIVADQHPAVQPATLAESAPAVSVAPVDPPTDHSWPIRIALDGRELAIYRVQPETLTDTRLTGRAGASLRDAADAMVFGAVWLDCRIEVDRAAGTVRVVDAVVTRARFPEAAKLDERAATDAVHAALAQQPAILPLRETQEAVDVARQENQAEDELSAHPPAVVVRHHPTLKVQYDGEPRFMPAGKESPLMQAVNTPFFVVLDPGAHIYWLEGAGQWFSAGDPLGPFTPAARAPAPVADLAATAGYREPDQSLSERQQQNVEVITATEPTELVWSDGAEEWQPIAGTGLLSLANSPADEFLDINAQRRYLLLSGRWYAGAGEQGPWEHVPGENLPADFRRIPPGSAKAAVLAAVPGTAQASDAVADAQVPRTAAIVRAEAQPPAVVYDGEPEFVPVADAVPVRYAVNTPLPVLVVDNGYYCCSDAVWYVGFSPIGPWRICTWVPPVIYTIPASCPVYYVRYVYVYDSTPSVVYVGYTPGYVGWYHHHGVVVWGTGYRYRPWVGQRFYVERPATFGFAATYQPARHDWGFRGAPGRAALLPPTARSTPPPPARAVWTRNGAFGAGGFRAATPVREEELPSSRAAPPPATVYNTRHDVVRREPTAPVAPATPPHRTTTVSPRTPADAPPPTATTPRPTPPRAQPEPERPAHGYQQRDDQAGRTPPTPSDRVETTPSRPAVAPPRTSAPPTPPPTVTAPRPTPPAEATPPRVQPEPERPAHGHQQRDDQAERTPPTSPAPVHAEPTPSQPPVTAPRVPPQAVEPPPRAQPAPAPEPERPVRGHQAEREDLPAPTAPRSQQPPPQTLPRAQPAPVPSSSGNDGRGGRSGQDGHGRRDGDDLGDGGQQGGQQGGRNR